MLRTFVRAIHLSSPAAKGLPPKYLAPLPPSSEAAAAIVAARRDIFGYVQGNGLRSGRKILRKALQGPNIASYYPTPISDLPLEQLGIEPPAREELFRDEQQRNRLGKTRIKGKMRGGTAQFQDKMRLQDVQVRRSRSINTVAKRVSHLCYTPPENNAGRCP